MCCQSYMCGCDIARAASARHAGLATQVTGIRAAKLCHKIRYDSMKVDAIIVTLLSQINKIACGNGHLVNVQLYRETPQIGLAQRGRVGATCYSCREHARRLSKESALKGVAAREGAPKHII